MEDKRIVIDPAGVLSAGKRYPQGTAVAQIPASSAELKAWTRFKQISEPEAEQPKAAKEKGSK